VTAERRRSKSNGDRRRRVVPRAVALLLLLGLVAGCGLGDKAHLASEIIGGVDHLENAGSAHGTLTLSLRLLDVPAEAATFTRAKTGLLGAPIAMAVNLAQKRATLGPADDPQFQFSGLTSYGRRVDAAQGDARPWMRIDLAALSAGDQKVNFTRLAPEAARNALNPTFLMDLIAGALTGSIKQIRASEVIDGVTTTPYSANFDIEKVLHDTRRDRYPEDDRVAIEKELDLLGVSGRVFPGTVWLDRDGVPRRFRVGLRISPRRGFVFEVSVDLRISAFGVRGQPRLPSELEVLETDSLGIYLQAVTAGRASA